MAGSRRGLDEIGFWREVHAILQHERVDTSWKVISSENPPTKQSNSLTNR
jgi:hypothetical protein